VEGGGGIGKGEKKVNQVLRKAFSVVRARKRDSHDGGLLGLIQAGRNSSEFSHILAAIKIVLTQASRSVQDQTTSRSLREGRSLYSEIVRAS